MTPGGIRAGNPSKRAIKEMPPWGGQHLCRYSLLLHPIRRSASGERAAPKCSYLTLRAPSTTDQ